MVETQVKNAGVVNLDQILEQTGTAKGQLNELINKLRRPQPSMGYRMYPRLLEELRSTLSSILGAQARPTDGLKTVLKELDGDAALRAQELTRVIDTAIAALNKQLGDQPKVLVPRSGGGR
jgi:ERCC4-type nuclease